ncbi:FAD-dependent pyridine nucleotide-disulfide oxidoreductase-like protein [Bimuria novae-zelandiae CBS 107.79]|uniref:FAD-dependent pyridine nucleotide-disulfide oxidoreductase-like protein n=1 Tax=Bimuria novae-zelandiae CBS 107.79 TaxID=1447943 RepID=A0A6A5VBC2_9PLEO|nr:FAD-dependent pyridine nucleotide-disulfide oxidoreductase-like protein [Bimuria novae-zelandiae CBS 107.79]
MATCPSVFDALVIGAGPAGLSAALALGRVMRTAAIFDTGIFRNAPANHMHTVPTWDHQSPLAYRQKCITELRQRYNGTIHFANTGVSSVKTGTDSNYIVIDESGKTWTGKKVILATGVKDILPDVKGYAKAWGRYIFHCLFCHGFEQRGSESAGLLVLDKTVLSNEVEIAVHFGHLAKQFAKKITVFLDSIAELLEDPRIKGLESQGFLINSKPIARITYAPDPEPGFATVHLEDGSEEDMSFLVHRPRTVLSGDFVNQLGLEVTEAGDVKTTPPFYETSVKGVFAAGDCAVPLKQVVWAVSTGVSAGSGVNFQVLAADMAARSKLS